jgi:hypothetical protein
MAKTESARMTLAALNARVRWATREQRLDAAKVETLLAGLGGKGGTLAHCRATPWRGALVLCREARDLPPTVAAAPGNASRWDRFVLELGPDAPPDLEIGPLGHAPGPDWAPAPARASLPSLRRPGEAAIVPRPGRRPGPWNSRLLFRPAVPLERIGFRVA